MNSPTASNYSACLTSLRRNFYQPEDESTTWSERAGALYRSVERLWGSATAAKIADEIEYTRAEEIHPAGHGDIA